MSAPRDLVVATGNRHKLTELRTMLEGLPFRVLSLADLPQATLMPEETGATFEENAAIKAHHVAAASGALALADDSGFEVEALGGRPGVISARYAGASGTQEEIDRANNAKIVAEARAAGLFRESEQGAHPRARFRCEIVVAAPGPQGGRVVARGSGSCDGFLLETPRGSGGFGYDPHFLLPEFGRTFAELTLAEKNAISHRSRAVSALRAALQAVALVDRRN